MDSARFGACRRGVAIDARSEPSARESRDQPFFFSNSRMKLIKASTASMLTAL